MDLSYVQTWWNLLELGKEKGTLDACVAHYSAKPQTPSCPTVILFGQEASYRMYAAKPLRVALDAWDLGRVSAYDIVRWGKLIQKEP